MQSIPSAGFMCGVELVYVLLKIIVIIIRTNTSVSLASLISSKQTTVPH